MVADGTGGGCPGGPLRRVADGHSRHGTQLRQSGPGRSGEARDLYHWHLTHQRNVVGTAVGLYYIRTSDPWPSSRRSSRTTPTPPGRKPPRTFQNSGIRDYSWPCVLVLVERWLQPEDFGTGPGQVSVDEKVPTTLYLPDGRTVPVCVVQVDPAEPARDPVPAWVWPERVIGGGLPVITRSQGEEHVASVGTLVTDGHTVYALTARHVCGPVGTPVSTRLRRHEVEVGQASEHQLMRVPFDVAYPDLVCHRTYLTLDAGLVEVDELADWTSQTYGLPPAGPFADLSEHNLTTKLVNAEVVAFGAASGYLRGRIAALLFRYRSIGGYDDITDFLIAPGPGQHGSQPGDSGTVWHLRQTADDGSVQLLPIALQWGGENLVGATPGRGFNFALASSLTNVLRLLDVSLVVDHNTQAQPFWGKTGHYTIASLACEHLRTSRLRTLMRNNLDRIGFQLVGARPRRHRRRHHEAEPEPAVRPARRRARPGLEEPADQGRRRPRHVVPPWAGAPHPLRRHRRAAHHRRQDPAPALHGRSHAGRRRGLAGVLQLARSHRPGGPRAAALPGLAVLRRDGRRRRGRRRGPVRLRGGAGVPLRRRRLAAAARVLPRRRRAGDTDPPAVGQGVHSAYESSMVDAFSTEILAGLQATLTHRGAEQGPILSGRDAAVAVVRLMDRTAKTLPPADLIAVFAQTQVGPDDPGPDGDPGRARHPVGTSAAATVKVMADGTRTLAAIWEAAFAAGKGTSTIPAAKPRPSTPQPCRSSTRTPTSSGRSTSTTSGRC